MPSPTGTFETVRSAPSFAAPVHFFCRSIANPSRPVSGPLPAHRGALRSGAMWRAPALALARALLCVAAAAEASHGGSAHASAHAHAPPPPPPAAVVGAADGVTWLVQLSDLHLSAHAWADRRVPPRAARRDRSRKCRAACVASL
jgi:hypothetical protein